MEDGGTGRDALAGLSIHGRRLAGISETPQRLLSRKYREMRLSAMVSEGTSAARPALFATQESLDQNALRLCQRTRLCQRLDGQTPPRVSQGGFLKQTSQHKPKPSRGLRPSQLHAVFEIGEPLKVERRTPQTVYVAGGDALLKATARSITGL